MIRVQLNLDGTPLGRSEFEKGRTVVVGRDSGCDLHIEDLGVSRKHCSLAFQAGRGWQVSDLGSSNGTHLNRSRIKQPMLLHDDDVISVGKFTLVVTTGRKRDNESTAIGWNVSPESMERSADRKGHLAPANETDPPVLIQQDALQVGSAARCDVKLSSGPGLLALLVRGYGGFQLLNLTDDPNAVRVNGGEVLGKCWLGDSDRIEFGATVYVFYAGLPADSFGTVQMNVADLNLGLLGGPTGGV